MPESPDFEKLARETYDTCTLAGWAEQLRQVWNARGAADIELLALDGTSRIGIDKMLQTLDR